ncbi:MULTISPECIES: glutathione peroxidase [Pseudomonas]|uniref:Glutathione peroxidase n=1 Tax=Pseudomonas citronellolis TaxID=53408 RepID=A0A1A9KFQ4_9PSED|nr:MULTISPECIES: glutathione peroxidase [Pseudomonas]ANI16271.1 glutathione peroxidase [Pseudomonas citronellolis]EJU9614690.1 glutathione peroxidase [Pseudomonas aeruginosa]EKU2930042.1 glutathione peroxidase [Pseudomonas aeruginosa]EKX3870091.1 glutathione peroxidase [Pseudomonas aeruginosa]ELM0223560.1 glutathione peroxidase [Pseudomonas aeruginosa]
MTAALFTIPITRIDGAQTSLADYAGQVLLVVNTASQCGLTPQYEGLEALHSRYREQGFAVLGFPANDFAGQEPGDDAEIQRFCSTAYAVDFPLFSKISVAGEGKHPLYAALIEARPRAQGGETFRQWLAGHGVTPNPEPEVAWNFEKFLVGRDGAVIARFAPGIEPQDGAIIEAIEAALPGQRPNT